MKVKFMNKFKPQGNVDYTFTNENLHGYMPELCKGAKRGVIVSASGDQIITASMLGVRDILGFDMNPMALCYTDLKLNALRTFEYRDFMRLFTTDVPIEDNRHMYDYLKSTLGANTRRCFDEKWWSEENGFPSYDPIIKKNPYMCDEASYKCAQSAISDTNVKLVHSSVRDLPCYLHKQYDIGVLSNIHHYAGKDYFDKQVAPLFDNIDKIQYEYCWRVNNPHETAKTGYKLTTLKFATSPIVSRGKWWYEGCYDTAIIAKREATK